MISGFKEKSHETMYKTNTKNGSKEVKSYNFSYCTVGRAITIWGQNRKEAMNQCLKLIQYISKEVKSDNNSNN